jgi:1-acyl-sn-glycerol-3-phosphate acyltransferase
MTRRLRAVWRLLVSIAHVLHGLTIVLTRFSALNPARREVLVRWWATKALRTMGIALHVEGTPHAGSALLVANHVSWLDIMAVHAVYPRARFVSKADVRSWPLLSRLIDAAGTLYLERERKRDALRVVRTMTEALASGQTVAIFPEGTTSDGHALLPFHANLLQAAIASGSPVQPIALRYSDAHDAVSRAVEFVGATTLVESLWSVASGEGVSVRVRLLPPLASQDADRRELAEQLRARIEAALQR